MRLAISLVILSLVSALFGNSQPVTKQLDSIVSQLSKQNGPGMTVLVAKKGQIIYQKATGSANLELSVAMKPDYIFRIGSITKQFTAISILQLAEAGKLKISDSVGQFVSGTPFMGKVSIEQLLTHTSGIRNYSGLAAFKKDMRSDKSPSQLIDLFKDDKLEFEPGSQFRYSNSNYTLLGWIIEKVSGLSFEQYLKKNILDPLDLKNTYFDQTSSIVTGRATGYQKRNNSFQNADYMSMTLPYSAGFLISNTHDQLKWFTGLLKGKLIRKETLQQAFSAHKLTDGSVSGYGYGWEIGNVQGITSVKHVGKINGFLTYVACIPAEEIVVAIFTNCDCTKDLDIPASRMAAIIMNKPYTFKRIHLSDNELELYQGAYRLNGQQTIIRLENGVLQYFSPGGGKLALIPIGKKKFQVKNTLTTLLFETSPAGRGSVFKSENTEMPQSWILSADTITAYRKFAVSAQDIQKFTGDYQFSQGFIFSIVAEGSKLYGQVGNDKKEIVPLAADTFYGKELDAVLIFTRDDTGKITGLRKIQNGEMSGTKL